MAKFMTKIDICPNFPIIDCNKFMVGVFNSGFPSGERVKPRKGGRMTYQIALCDDETAELDKTEELLNIYEKSIPERIL